MLRRLMRWVLGLAGAFAALSLIQVCAIRFVDPPFTPLMVYRWATGNGWDFRWRPLVGISPFLQQAVMASEDQLFPTHGGFDWRQIQEAVQEYERRGRLRGASTITMQVARNVFLWQGGGWFRKGLEAYYTVLIEFLWPKWRIMEIYLNVIEWGPGVFGAEAAARRHFHRPAASLTKTRAALLAAVLPNPLRWSPVRPTAYIQERQSIILRQMNRFAPFTPGSR